MNGKPYPLAMEVINFFVSPGEGCEPSEDLRHEIRRFVMKRLSRAASLREIEFSVSLSKTRNGRIRRRLLKAGELVCRRGIRPPRKTTEVHSVHRHASAEPVPSKAGICSALRTK